METEDFKFKTGDLVKHIAGSKEAYKPFPIFLILARGKMEDIDKPGLFYNFYKLRHGNSPHIFDYSEHELLIA
jgi:hypothetical protein